MSDPTLEAGQLAAVAVPIDARRGASAYGPFDTTLDAAVAVDPAALDEPGAAPLAEIWLKRAWWFVAQLLKLAAMIGALTLLRASVADQYLVPTASMWPTIAPGDRIFVSKVAYGLRLPGEEGYAIESGRPAPGEVIVFGDPRGGPIPLVKRVIATEGQKVAMKKGVLYVDGRPQKLEMLAGGRVVEHLGEVTHGAGARDYEDFATTTVPKGHVFVMGDNRSVSLDSRVIGAIPLNLIRGKVLGTVFHYDGAGFDASRALRAID